MVVGTNMERFQAHRAKLDDNKTCVNHAFIHRDSLEILWGESGHGGGGQGLCAR